jgi:hypothetical protein
MTTEKQQLQNQKTELVRQKREHETQLLAIKNLVRSSGKMPHEKYKTCCDAQTRHSQSIRKIEYRLGDIKNRLQEIADIEFHERNQSVDAEKISTESTSAENEPKSMVVELVALRQHYQEFSADATRVSSMRQMAADFVLKLNPIIKRAINVG